MLMFRASPAAVILISTRVLFIQGSSVNNGCVRRGAETQSINLLTLWGRPDFRLMWDVTEQNHLHYSL